jgi:hypothetical protein
MTVVLRLIENTPIDKACRKSLSEKPVGSPTDSSRAFGALPVLTSAWAARVQVGAALLHIVRACCSGCVLFRLRVVRVACCSGWTLGEATPVRLSPRSRQCDLPVRLTYRFGRPSGSARSVSPHASRGPAGVWNPVGTWGSYRHLGILSALSLALGNEGSAGDRIRGDRITV